MPFVVIPFAINGEVRGQSTPYKNSPVKWGSSQVGFSQVGLSQVGPQLSGKVLIEGCLLSGRCGADLKARRRKHIIPLVGHIYEINR